MFTITAHVSRQSAGHKSFQSKSLMRVPVLQIWRCDGHKNFLALKKINSESAANSEGDFFDDVGHGPIPIWHFYVLFCCMPLKCE
jgi:hypothetical protein